MTSASTAVPAIIGIGAVLVVIVIVVVIVTASSGGDSTPTGSASPVSADQVTCAVLSQSPDVNGKLTFADGGSVPPGVPLPSSTPAHVCSGSPDDGSPVNALIWPDETQSGYEQILGDRGWTSRAAGAVLVYASGDSEYEIAVLTVDDALVAIYHQGQPTPSSS